MGRREAYPAGRRRQRRPGSTPRSSSSRCAPCALCSASVGAAGSKRPRACARLYASTVSGSASYVAAGMVYLSTAETSVSAWRRAAGRASAT